MRMAGKVDEEFAGKVREISSEFDVPEIPANRAAALVAAGEPVVVIDVRSRSEFEVSKIPGAVHVGKGSRTTLAEVVDEALTTHDHATWMMCCAGGYKSARAIEGLPKQLRRRVFNIVGGMIGYANAGGPLVDPKTDEPVSRLHGYDETWARYIKPPNEPVT